MNNRRRQVVVATAGSGFLYRRTGFQLRAMHGIEPVSIGQHVSSAGHIVTAASGRSVPPHSWRPHQANTGPSQGFEESAHPPKSLGFAREPAVASSSLWLLMVLASLPS